MFTVSINNNANFLKNMKQAFKRKTSWSKYSGKKNNLDYMIHPTFRNINRPS